jgi:hypothetical protein
MYVNGNRLEDIIWDPLPGQLPPPGKRHVGPDPGCPPVPPTMMTSCLVLGRWDGCGWWVWKWIGGVVLLSSPLVTRSVSLNRQSGWRKMIA